MNNLFIIANFVFNIFLDQVQNEPTNYNLFAENTNVLQMKFYTYTIFGHKYDVLFDSLSFHFL